MACKVESQLREFASRGLSQRHSAQLLGINREKVRVLCKAIQPPIEWPGINQSIGSKLSCEGRRGTVTSKMALAINKSKKQEITVQGQTINEHTVGKTSVWAVTTNGFTSGDLQGRLLRYGAPNAAVKQGADVLLRKWKKAGNVSFRNGKWHWQGVK